MRAPGQMSDCPAPLTHRNRVARLAPFSPSMNATQRTALIQRIEAELKGNILPFWIKHVVDRERGGFYGEISHDLVVDRAADRGALLTSRILWTYASAYRHYRDPAHLEMAHWAYADLVKTHWDSEFGGLFWSVTADGRPKATRKQIYGLAFGTYAMSELHRATGEQEPLERAITLYRLIEQHSRDRRHGGYFEACKRDWSLEQDVRLSAIDLNEPKSQNTHLHVMEGYTNLLRVWPDPELRSAQAELLEVMLTRILDPGTHHLGLFFNETWELRYPRISYGHDIEAAWLLTEAAEVVTIRPCSPACARPPSTSPRPPSAKPSTPTARCSTRATPRASSSPTRSGGPRPRPPSASSTPTRSPATSASSPPPWDSGISAKTTSSTARAASGCAA